LAVAVRLLTRRFPRIGYTSLKEQMIRAAESIPFNIAEGCGASTQKEFGRFLDISIKSASELESELELAKDSRIVADEEWDNLSTEVTGTRRMLCALRRKVLGTPDDRAE